MKKPDYQLKLRELAPSVSFEVEWSPDEDARWEKEWGEQGNFEAYNTDVRAKAIVKGEIIEGWECMGGTWEIPDKKDPEIGGYLPQMLLGAAEDLMKQVIPMELEKELTACVLFLKALLRERWEAQQREKVPA